MKISVSFVLCLMSYSDMSSQSADELWRDLQLHYQSISNYVDQGEYIRYIYGEEIVSSTIDYTMAIDSNQNVYHHLNGHRGVYNYTYEYRKSADRDTGIMARDLGGSTDDVLRSLGEACASLYAVGGGILDMAASLMFPDIYGSEYEGQAPMLKVDSIARAQDTVISGEPVYIIEAYSSTYVSQENIDEIDRRHDSIDAARLIPPYVSRHTHLKPGFRKNLNRYFIRQSDGLICRRETYRFEGDAVKSKSILTMSPRSNVPEFERFLTVENPYKE